MTAVIERPKPARPRSLLREFLALTLVFALTLVASLVTASGCASDRADARRLAASAPASQSFR